LVGHSELNGDGDGGEGMAIQQWLMATAQPQHSVFPDHPDRAYVGYIDGGQLILDISGLADVRAGKATNFAPS
jgi:hypothetical protein